MDVRYFNSMNSVRSNNLSLKYKRFTPSGCKVSGIKKFEFWQGLNSFVLQFWEKPGNKNKGKRNGAGLA